MLRAITNTVGITTPFPFDELYNKYTSIDIADDDYNLVAQHELLNILNSLLQEDKFAYGLYSSDIVVDIRKIRKGYPKTSLCGSLPLAFKKENKHLKINIRGICEIDDYCGLGERAVNRNFVSIEGLQYLLSNILRYNTIVNKLPKTQSADEWIQQLLLDIKPKTEEDNLIGILLNNSNQWSCITRGLTHFPDDKEYAFIHAWSPQNAICLSFNELTQFLHDFNNEKYMHGEKYRGVFSYILVFKTPESYVSKTSENIKLSSRSLQLFEYDEKRYLLRLMKVLLHFLPKGTFPNGVDPIEIMKSQPKIYNKTSIETTLQEDFNIKPQYLVLLHDNRTTDVELLNMLQRLRNANVAERLPRSKGSRSLISVVRPQLQPLVGVSDSSPSLNLLSNNEITRSDSIGSESIISRSPTPPANGGLVVSAPPAPAPPIKLRPTMANINMSWFNQPQESEPVMEETESKTEEPESEPIMEETESKTEEPESEHTTIPYYIDPNVKKQLMNLFNSWTIKGGKRFKRRGQRKTRKRRPTHKL